MAFSRPGKIMKYEKKANIMEKSWNFKIPLWKKSWKKVFALHSFYAKLSLYMGYYNCQNIYCTFMLS